MPLLEFRGVSKRFGHVQALADVSFDVRRGEVHCLVGENGAGKSTLIKCLSGAYQADSGEIVLDGQPLRARGPLEAIGKGVSVVYQDLSIVPNMAVVDNILLGGENHTAGWVHKRKNAEEVRPYLEMVGLDLDPKTPMSALSMAQQQMVAIAGALHKRAKILVLDEPTAMLSDEEVATLFDIVRKLRGSGIAILYISHRMQELYDIGDRVSVLKDGQFVGTYQIAEITTPELITRMVGRDLKDIYPERSRVPGEPVLEVRGLCSAKLRDVSFRLCAGEVIGLAGLVGSGRSEVLRAILGADARDQGEILVAGEPVRIRHPADAIRAGIGMVPEDRRGQGMVGCLSVRANLVEIYSRLRARWGFVRHRDNAAVAQRYIGELKVKTPGAEQIISKLSGGNQQKVILAKWMSISPRILLLDEPTQGIDVGTKAELYALIDELARAGYGIVLVSSDLLEILNLSDRILVLRDGEIAGELDGKVATENEVLSYAMR